MILMYTFCTDCWLLAVLYFTWLAFDWNTPKKGKCLGLLLVFLPPGGMSVGRGTLGRCRNAAWAGRHLPGGFTLAVSLPPAPSQHCALFPGRWQEIAVGAKLGRVALFPRLLSHPGKDVVRCFGRMGIDGDMNCDRVELSCLESPTLSSSLPMLY